MHGVYIRKCWTGKQVLLLREEEEKQIVLTLSNFFFIRRYKSQCGELATAIFRSFDVHNSGTIDYASLISGLSVLTHSPTGDKVAVAFLAVDTFSRHEIETENVETIIKSILKVICVCSASAREHFVRLIKQSAVIPDQSIDINVLLASIDTGNCSSQL